jgi:lysophospholipase L1-like esterase
VAPGTWSVLGSSVTAGAAASSPSQAWVAKLAAAVGASGVTIANLAVSGSNTYHWMPASAAPPAGRPAPYANNIDAAMAPQPKLLILSATTNDLASGFSADEMVGNLLALRTFARGRGATVLVLSTLPRNLPDAVRALLPSVDDRLATVAGNCFVALRAALAAPDGRLAASYDIGDGVHANDAGHALIFNLVDAALQSGRCVAAPH